MAIDWDELEKAKELESSSNNITQVSDGKPLEINVEDIIEDESQPRTIFDEEKHKTLTQSIKEVGVKSPISVRPHPDSEMTGKWIINHGARRLRASIDAGKKTIPAFIDENYTDYDQVMENKERDDLKPIELAIFIKKKIDEGEKKINIASKLRIDNASITHHLALLELPECIAEVYRSGKSISPKTLYELKRAYDIAPESVENLCSSSEEINRKDVTLLLNEIKKSKDVPQTENQQSSIASFGHDQKNENLTTEEQANSESNPNANTFRKPVLHVTHNGAPAIILMKCVPSMSGKVVIQYQNKKTAEVSAQNLKIEFLDEA